MTEHAGTRLTRIARYQRYAQSDLSVGELATLLGVSERTVLRYKREAEATMGDMAAATPVFEGAFPVSEPDKNDVAYHIAAMCGPGSLEDALELAEMLTIGHVNFRHAEQEIWDHRSGQCPPQGHRGRPCSDF